MNLPTPLGRDVTRCALSVSSLFTIWAIALSGCGHPELAKSRLVTPTQSAEFSKEELRHALDQYDQFFESTIKQATAEIDERSPDLKTRRLTLMWKVRMVPANDAALKEPDSLKAFVECWKLAVRMTEFLEAGEGRSLFGKNQAIAVAAARKIEVDIERVGASFLPPERLSKARDDVHAVAAAQPMRDTFAEAVVRTPPTRGGAPSPLASIVGVPLAPFRAMEGIDQGAAAIRSFTDIADRFTDIVQELPESLGWQLQLALLDLGQNDVVLAFLASLAEFSSSAARLASTAERLPEDLRQQASKLVAEIDARQAGIQATLERAEKTAATVERALDRVDVVAASLDRTGQSVADAGKAWEGAARQIVYTIQDIRHDRDPSHPTSRETNAASTSAPPPPAPQPGPATTTASERPFEIMDYRDTADALTTTAQQLRALAAEVRGTIESQGLANRIHDLDGRVLGAVDHTSNRARSLADHIAWRAVQLILLVFVLVVAYRVVSNRLPRKAR